ncbi:MAG: tetratricopeptide (TPR) repeat protein [Akkermansiaceae bacterium]
MTSLSHKFPSNHPFHSALSFKMTFRSLCLFSLTIPALLAETITVSPEWFQTPEFRKRFVGSYGFLPAVEPKVDQEEAQVIAELSEILGAGRFKEAENRLLAFIKERKNPVDPDSEAKDVSAALVYTLGNLYYQNGRLAEAESAYKTSIKRFPEYRRAHKNLALLYARSERMKEAKSHLIKAIDLGDADHLSFGLLGHAMLAEEQALAAESAFRQAYLLNPDEKDWKIGLVQALLLKEDWLQAASMMQSLIDESPDDPVMWMQQANCYLQTGEVMRAAENYEVLRLKGLADEASLNTLGDIYANQEEPLLALGAYLTAIRMSKEIKIERSLKSAGYLLQLEAPKEAAKLMTTMREKVGETLTKDQKVAAFLVESDIALADKDLTMAGDLLKNALEVSPANGSAQVKLGAIYLSLSAAAGTNEKIAEFKRLARGQFRQATRSTEAKVGYDANRSLGQVLVKEQEYLKALPYLEEAVRLKTGSKQTIEQYLRRVQRAAERQKEREERLDQERREIREALNKDAEAKQADEESKNAAEAKGGEKAKTDPKKAAENKQKEEGE